MYATPRFTGKYLCSGMSTDKTWPYVPKISCKCSLVTFLVNFSTNTLLETGDADGDREYDLDREEYDLGRERPRRGDGLRMGERDMERPRGLAMGGREGVGERPRGGVGLRARGGGDGESALQRLDL
jgi:hypothetical protein